MAHTKIIAAVLAVVVVAGGAYYMVKSRDGGENPSQTVAQNTQNNTPAQNQNGKKIPFSDFVRQFGTYKCTVNQSINNQTVSGITYMHGGQIRAEYKTSVNGMFFDTNFIVRDGYSFTWSSLAPNMGFKSKLATTGVPATPGASASGNISFNMEDVGDYNCDSWVYDASKFQLPSSVTFTEM